MSYFFPAFFNSHTYSESSVPFSYPASSNDFLWFPYLSLNLFAVICFRPPYSKSVRSNIALDFLKLIDKHFPKTNPLHKTFIRNTIKVSNSCLENVKRSISRHNKSLLRKAEPTKSPNELCNCRAPSECPLEKKCLTESMVYN